MYSRNSTSSEWDGKTFSLHLTSIFPVTCYAAVLWPDLWLQWQSDHCLWGCSGVQSDMNTLELGGWRNMWGECEWGMQWVSKLMLYQITRLSLPTVCHKLLTYESDPCTCKIMVTRNDLCVTTWAIYFACWPVTEDSTVASCQRFKLRHFNFPCAPREAPHAHAYT